MASEFAKEKVFWTRKMNLKLVKFIEKRPLLWQKMHPKYKSMRLRNEIYAEFAAQYGDEFSAQAVKDRWVNIRTTFGHHLRKLKASTNQEGYEVKWHLWDACQFLHNSKETNGDSFYEDISTERKTKKLNKSEANGDIPEYSLDCNNVADQLLNVFKGVQNDVFGLNESEHAKLGDAVTKKLQSLNSYEAAKLSQNIMHILLLYDRNNPDNCNSNKVKDEG